MKALEAQIRLLNEHRLPVASLGGELFVYQAGRGWMHDTIIDDLLLRGGVSPSGIEQARKARRIRFALPVDPGSPSPTLYWRWTTSGEHWDGGWEPLYLSPTELMFEDCRVDLMTGEVSPDGPAVSPVFGPILTAPYQPDSTHEDWTAFLDRFLPDPAMRTYVRRACSIVIAPHNFSKSVLIVFGEANTGKSTLLSAIATAPGGPCGQTTISPSRAAQSPFHTYALLNRFAAICEEFESISRPGVSWLKSYTGGSFEWEVKFGLRGNSLPTAKILAATNALPDFYEDSRALYHRMVLVPMHSVFDGTGADPNRSTSFYWAEPSRRAAVLAWLIGGYAELVSNDFRLDAPGEIESIRATVHIETNPYRRVLMELYEATDSGDDRVLITSLVQDIRQATGDRLAYRRVHRLVAELFPRAERERYARRVGTRWEEGSGFRGLRRRP